MAQKGSQHRAEANPALRVVCAHCGKSIPTEVGHAHPLDAEDRGVWRETWGLLGVENGGRKFFRPVMSATRLAGARRALSTEPTCARSSATIVVRRTLGRKSTTYSAPRWSSV